MEVRAENLAKPSSQTDMSSLGSLKVNRARMLIIGASGMLGSTLVRYYSSREVFDVFASTRDADPPPYLIDDSNCFTITGIQAERSDDLLRLFEQSQPDIVVNCVGVVKQLAASDDALVSIPLNSLLPHYLAGLCASANSRLIHFSTDCVFSGNKGRYVETDIPDATDMYGRSKLLGEIDYSNAITLRTSIIGHELSSTRSLVNWFLAQKDTVNGFEEAIFSGLPTVEIARVIEEYVLPNPELNGVYHLSADPISKYDLLLMLKDVYRKQIEIVPDSSLVIDRSLDSTRFRLATGFSPKPWPEMIQAMHNFG